MKVTLNLKKLIELKINATQYLLLLAITHDKLDNMLKYVLFNDLDLYTLQSLKVLEIKDITKLTFSIRPENIAEAKKLLSIDNIVWVREWLDLWPEGVKSMGYYVKSNVESVETKMEAFIHKHDYNKNVIMTATSKYIEEMRHKGWKGMQLAQYFIEKNKSSTLETYCREVTRVEDHESRIIDDFNGISA
jgi:hypothetical protein